MYTELVRWRLDWILFKGIALEALLTVGTRGTDLDRVQESATTTGTGELLITFFSRWIAAKSVTSLNVTRPGDWRDRQRKQKLLEYYVK